MLNVELCVWSLVSVCVGAGANRKMDDDGIMVSIYEDIQEELKDRTEVVKEKQQMVSVLFALCVDFGF